MTKPVPDVWHTLGNGPDQCALICNFYKKKKSIIRGE